mmetsp:Transcript_4229/g.10318  ORF Transcript_4229/g.10318 Transcript_4229/m.10318 type:complete len:346 (+) Transcript_4229:75-1112(+)
MQLSLLGAVFGAIGYRIDDLASELPASSSSDSAAANKIMSALPAEDPSSLHPLVDDTPVVGDLPVTPPTDVPSSVPNDVPSSVPKDVPSSVPKDVPSVAPTKMVSTTEFNMWPGGVQSTTSGEDASSESTPATTASRPAASTTVSPAGNSSDAMCTAHSGCVAIGAVAGACCPAADGNMLSCCDDPVEVNSTAKCSNNPGCAAFPGNCCPANDGTMLSCCTDVAEQDPAAKCEKHASCSELGIPGNCCPANDGTMLACCSDTHFDDPLAKCSAHEACKDLPGNCCPAPGGAMLACCNSEPSEATLTLSKLQKENAVLKAQVEAELMAQNTLLAAELVQLDKSALV